MKRIVNALGKLSLGKGACAVSVLCAATAIALNAQTFTRLHSFNGTNNEVPNAALVQSNNGDLYGIASGGGANGQGTIFKITPTGTLTTLYSFCSQSGCTDGENPEASLVQAPDGDFYGTTYEGGANGQGTIFKITPTGTLTTLYSFCSQSDCADGYRPAGGLVQAANGDLYGTALGGAHGEWGTIFKITPSGTFTTLYSFCSQSIPDCTDGAFPSGLVQAANEDFYGTTSYGGASNTAAGGYGTVFKITPSGTLTTLYSFCSQTDCTDGYFSSALIQATDGNLYGTTYFGGASGIDGEGTVFKIT